MAVKQMDKTDFIWPLRANYICYTKLTRLTTLNVMFLKDQADRYSKLLWVHRYLAHHFIIVHENQQFPVWRPLAKCYDNPLNLTHAEC